MRLYIANATKQVHDFIYRLPESPNAHKQQIEIGGQIVLAQELNSLDIDAVIEQHALYGLVKADEIDRARAFTGMCYSVDKPVSLPNIQKLFLVNHNALLERGQEIRKAAAVAVESQLQNNLGENAGLGAVEMSVVEETSGSTRSGIDDQNASAPIAEGVRVTRSAEPPKGARRRRA